MRPVSSERIPFMKASLKVRPIAMASPTDFIWEETLEPNRAKLRPKTYVVAHIPDYLRFPLNLLALVMSVLTLMAGIRMLQRRSYGLVMTGVIIGMLPCLSACCCTGLPFGIWALVVLSNEEVRKSFH